MPLLTLTLFKMQLKQSLFSQELRKLTEVFRSALWMLHWLIKFLIINTYDKFIFKPHIDNLSCKLSIGLFIIIYRHASISNFKHPNAVYHSALRFIPDDPYGTIIVSCIIRWAGPPSPSGEKKDYLLKVTTLFIVTPVPKTFYF